MKPCLSKESTLHHSRELVMKFASFPLIPPPILFVLLARNQAEGFQSRVLVLKESS